MLTSLKKTNVQLERFSLIFFLIAMLPLLFSLSVHTGVLYLSKNIEWRFGQETRSKEEVPKTIVLDGRRDDGLKFQGTDQLDSFQTDDKMAYPLPEIEYRAVSPEVDFYPDAKVSEKLDIISIEAAAMDALGQPLHGASTPLYRAGKICGVFSRFYSGH